METFRCPTCLGVLIDADARRCPACHARLRRRTRPPIVLGEDTQISAHQLHIDRVLLERITVTSDSGDAGADVSEPWRSRFETESEGDQLVAEAPAADADAATVLGALEALVNATPAATQPAPEPAVPAAVVPAAVVPPLVTPEPVVAAPVAPEPVVAPPVAPEPVVVPPVVAAPVVREPEPVVAPPVACEPEPVAAPPVVREPEPVAAPPVPEPEPVVTAPPAAREPEPVDLAAAEAAEGHTTIFEPSQLDPEVRELLDDLYRKARAELGEDVVPIDAANESSVATATRPSRTTTSGSRRSWIPAFIACRSPDEGTDDPDQ